MQKPITGERYTLQQYADFNLLGRTRFPCKVTSLMKQCPDAIPKLTALLDSEFGLVRPEGFRFRGNGHQALVISVGQNQIIRFSPSSEEKRINSEYVLRNHTRMRVVELENHYEKIEVAAFPCIRTLGEAIDSGFLSEGGAIEKFAELRSKILAQGYFLIDGADYNLAIPRENIGVFDNGDLVVLDGGMFGVKPVDFNQFHDFSREVEAKPYSGPISPLENEPPRVSKSQLDHMRSRGLNMGKFSSPTEMTR